MAEREDYPAGFSQISEFIIKMHDLKPAQVMEVGASQRGRLEVEEPGAAKSAKSGTLVEFRGADGKPIRHFVLGKSHMHSGAEASQFGDGGWPDGRYVLPSAGSGVVDLVSDPISAARTQTGPMVGQGSFFKIEKPKSISLESPVATNSWKVAREVGVGGVEAGIPRKRAKFWTVQGGVAEFRFVESQLFGCGHQRAGGEIHQIWRRVHSCEPAIDF